MLDLLLMRLIHLLENVLTLLVIVYVLMTYVVPPWNRWRQALARIVEPMLAPLRRVIPPLGPVDISPLVLLILIQVIADLLISIIRQL